MVAQKEPAGQAEQLIWPTLAWYRPAAQHEHAAADPVAKRPAEQAVYAVAPAGQEFPLGQALH